MRKWSLVNQWAVENVMDSVQMKQLGEKLDQLIQRLQQLESDNAHLKAQQQEWADERLSLIRKNDLARDKIEAMIGRLKALEQR